MPRSGNTGPRAIFMPEDAVVTPEAPPTLPAPTPDSDLPLPQVIKASSPEDDPNHQMALLLAKRREKKAKEGEKDGKTTDVQPPTEGTKTPENQPQLGDLIANALKFRGKKPEAKADPKAKEAAPPENKAKAPPAEPSPPEKPEKTVISKRAPADPGPSDTARIASEAATAATKAAMAAIKPSLSDADDPSATLKATDKREYAIAQYLAKTNPRYKDAPKIILDHVKKAEAYLARWEASNPDKDFSSKDPEHDDFYESLEKPWSDDEFRDAEIKMVAEPIAEAKTTAAQAKIKELEASNARLELVPVIDRTFMQVATTLAKSLGDETFDKVSKSFDSFADEDPITAGAIAKTLAELRPLIETAIQIDDPKGRISFDMNDPVHQVWNEIVHEGERRYVGVKDEDGRMFAKRADYGSMNAAQRSRAWYLTKDHIISGIVEETSKLLVDHVKNEKEKQIKIAQSLGYIPKPVEIQNKEKPVGTKTKIEDPPKEEPAAAVKPASPTVGSGAKIDNSSNSKPTGRAATIAAMHDILWKR